MASAKSAAIESTALGYWQLSRLPWTSLVFIAPMLVIYEVGVLALGRAATRNGADVWLRTLLDEVGFGQYFLLPVLACGLLLAWQYLTRAPWTLRGKVLAYMLLECLVLGWLLLIIAQAQGTIASQLAAAVPAEVTSDASTTARLGRMIGMLGAGIYEELLFRLLLLPVAIAALKACGLSPRTSIVTAIIAVSLVFSAAHYKLDLDVGPWHIATRYGDAWSLYTFTFRFLAGVFFAVLFQLRGFGVAAGSHALYDVAVALM